MTNRKHSELVLKQRKSNLRVNEANLGRQKSKVRRREGRKVRGWRGEPNVLQSLNGK